MTREERKNKRIANLRTKGDTIFRESPIKRFFKGFEKWYRNASLGLASKILHVKTRNIPLDPAKIRSVLILRRDGIGDIIVSSGIWRSLKHYYPHIKIGIAGSFRNLDLVRLDPAIDVRYDFSFLSIRDTIRVLRRSQKEHWDVVLCLTATKRTNAAINARLAAPHAIDTTIADPSHQPRYTKLFDIAIKSKGVQVETNMLDFLREHVTGVFGFTPSKDVWHPSLFIDPIAISEVDEQLRTITNGKPFVVLNTEASEAVREWGAKNCLALSKMLVDARQDLFVFWLASPHTAERTITDLQSQPMERVQFLPTRGLHHLAAVVRRAELVISPDTSVIHFAVAQHKPVVGLYHRRNPFSPYNVPNTIFYPTVGEPTATIPVEPVFEAVITMLGSLPAE